MEKLSFSPLGQWTLHKSWTTQQKHQMVFGWGENGDRESLDETPPAEGPLREKMLQHLQSSTSHRVNNKGEREYLLHRASATKDDRHNKERTSWTTNHNFALQWASIQRPSPSFDTPEELEEMQKYGKDWKVMSAWVPEQYIHSFLPTVQQEMDTDKAHESEAIVMPHDVKVHRQVQGAELNRKIGPRE